MPSNQAVTTWDASRLLWISIDTIRRRDKKWVLKSTRNSNNTRLFDLEDIRKLQDISDDSKNAKEFRILKSIERSSYTSIELFAWAGGTALGMHNAGINHILLNEIDKHACKTLQNNMPDWNIIQWDIRNISFEGITADIVQGWSPCQSFSYAWKQLWFEDIRGTLFFEFARCVKEVRPKIAVLENVKWLINHDGGRTIEVMINTLKEIWYKVQYKLLRSQYLDIPQKRERLVLIWIRNDLNIDFVFPKEKNYIITLKSALKDCPPSLGQKYPEKKKQILELIPQGWYWRDLPVELQKEYMGRSFYLWGWKTWMARRLSWDEPSLTLTCSPAQKQTERCHPSETRPLNIREYARIQTFPDDWKFSWSISQQYKQIGNAVPVNLWFYIWLSCRAMLDGLADIDSYIAQ